MNDLPLWKQLQLKCIHFNGLVNDACKLGIAYADVREESEAGPHRYPCLRTPGREVNTPCPRVRFCTDEEARVEAAALNQWLDAYFENLQAGICPICGAQVQKERQVGRCVYADPCGHRLYQGRAKGSDEINAAMMM